MRKIYFILLIFTLVACYQHKDIYFKDIDLSKTGETKTIDFFSEDDSVFIKYNSLIHINVEESYNKNDIYGYQLLLDNNVVIESDGYPSSFYFESYNYQDGFYNLTLRIYSKSNTGSLADYYGVESYVYDFKKVLYIGNNSELTPPKIEGFEVIDGVLNVNIRPYKGVGFESYRLIVDDIIVIENYDKNTFRIPVPEYFGGERDFRLELTAEYDRKSDSKVYSYNPNFNIAYRVDSVTLTWDEVPFRDSEYLIFQARGLDGSVSSTVDISKGKSSLKLDLGFPYHYSFYVYFISSYNQIEAKVENKFHRSKTVNIDYFDYYTIRENNVITSFEKNVYGEMLGAFTVTNYSIIYNPENEYDSLVPIKSVKNVVYSDDYNYLYQINLSDINQLDPLTLEVISSKEISTFIGGEKLKMTFCSSNGLVCFWVNKTELITINWESGSEINRSVLDCIDSWYYGSNSAREFSSSGIYLPQKGYGYIDSGRRRNVYYKTDSGCRDDLPYLFNLKTDEFMEIRGSEVVLLDYYGRQTGGFERGNFNALGAIIDRNSIFIGGNKNQLEVYDLDTQLKEFDFRVSERVIKNIYQGQPHISNGKFTIKGVSKAGRSVFILDI